MANSQKPTLKDVAALAGVSQMTASAVLSGKSAQIRISVATQARVREAANRIQYRPNALARSFRQQSTNIIGFYGGSGYVNAATPFHAEIIGGLQEACEELQKELLLHGIFRRRSTEDIYAALIDGRIDGLVLYAPLDDALIERLASSHLPVVAIVDAVPSLPSVIVDDADGARQTIAYLRQQEYRRILYWYRAHERELVSVVRRRDAFMDEADRYGLNVCEWSPPPLEALNSYMDLSCLEWLDRPPSRRPDVVVCWNDDSAYAFLVECHRRGLRVPDDIAIIGFDGIPTPYEPIRRLTTIRAPWRQVARTAVSLLAAQLQGGTSPAETVLPVQFVHGNTA